MKFYRLLTPLLLALLVALPMSQAQKRFAKWEKSIAAFEQEDKENPPNPDAFLFVGSSTIRMWDLEKFFPNRVTLNRGFGGSTIADSIHFFDRIIKPRKPKMIVMYAGDNDISKGMSPQEVFGDFKIFSEKVQSSLPNTSLIFIAIKPSIKRKDMWSDMKKANELIASYCSGIPALHYADIATPMLELDLSADLFKKDGLHLSDKGYTIWKGVLVPLMDGKK